MAFLHFMMGSITEVQKGLQVSKPYTTAFVFGVLGLLHLHGVLHLFKDTSKAYSKKSRKSVVPESNKTSRRNSAMEWYDTYFGADGVYGRRGGRYEYRLMVREMIEIPSQSYQAYLMCHTLPHVHYAFVYSLIIFADCLLVPLIMQIRKIEKLRRRNRVLVVDLLVDTVLGAMFPLTTLIPTAKAYLGNPGVITSSVWLGEAFASTKYFVVTSNFQLFLSAMPLLFSHLLNRTVHSNWCDLANKSMIVNSKKPIVSDDVLPNPSIINKGPSTVHEARNVRRTIIVRMGSRILPTLERLFGFGIVVWGFLLLCFVLSGMYRPTCTSEFAIDACKSKVHPWFVKSSDCFCLVIDMDCDSFDPLKNQTVHANYSNALNEHFDTATPLITHITNCNLQEAPKVLESYTALFELRITHCAMTEFDIDFQNHANLFVVHLGYTDLSELPSVLSNVPSSLFYLGIDHSKIREFPNTIMNTWTTISSLALRQNNLHQIPDAIFSLSNLREIFIEHNHIQVIPDNIAKLQNLAELNIANNSLTIISPEILELPRLSWISLEMNYLDKVPWSTQTIANWQGILYLDYNPICNATHPIQIHDTKSCIRSCSPLCHDAILHNYRCEFVCNTSACNFDNGLCLAK